jgi:hypothetical protein
MMLVRAGDSPKCADTSVEVGVVIDPGSYWVAISSDSGGAGVARDYSYGDGAANWYGNSAAFADGPSLPCWMAMEARAAPRRHALSGTTSTTTAQWWTAKSP